MLDLSYISCWILFSNILRLAIHCHEDTLYKVYINGAFHTDLLNPTKFVPDLYKLEMEGSTDAAGVWSGQMEWFHTESK